VKGSDECIDLSLLLGVEAGGVIMVVGLGEEMCTEFSERGEITLEGDTPTDGESRLSWGT